MMQSDEEDNEVKGQDESGSDLSLADVPKHYFQENFNDLVRNLGFSKEHLEFLGSSLKKKHLLSAGVTFSWYRHRQKEFTTRRGKRRLLQKYTRAYESTEIAV